VLVHQLGIIGFHVDAADDGQKALELLTSNRSGLVFTDLNMPAMDGFELAAAIRRHEHEHSLFRVPIIALSANVMPGEAERCAAAGMDDFLGKPAPMPALVDKLQRWLPHVEWPAEPAEREEGSGHDSDRIIDRGALTELTGGDSGLAAAILLDYVDSLQGDLSALSGALTDASAEEVRRTAHRIKGAGRTVGATEVARLAAGLETAASIPVDDWHLLRSTAENLEVAAAEVARALTAEPVPSDGPP